MATPFTFSGVLTYPPDDGQPTADRDFAVSSTFDSKAEYDFVFSGSGSQAVSFGTIGSNGAKVVLVEVAADASPSAQPINVQFNAGGAPGQAQVAPGGFLAYCNPNPATGGVASITIAYTTNAKVKVRALG